MARDARSQENRILSLTKILTSMKSLSTYDKFINHTCVFLNPCRTINKAHICKARNRCIFLNVHASWIRYYVKYVNIVKFLRAFRDKARKRNPSPQQILYFLRSHGGTYGLPPYFSHSRLNSCSRTSAPRFLVNPVSSRLNSHICISSIPDK